MPKTQDGKRRTGKGKRRRTFNKYGKNTARGLRHIVAQQKAHENKQNVQQKNSTKKKKPKLSYSPL